MLLSLGGNKMRSWELDHLILSFSSSQFERLFSLRQHSLKSAAGLKHSSSAQSSWYCSPSLENCLSLSGPDTPPLAITLLSLGIQRSLALPALSLVLPHFTESLTAFRNVHYVWVSTTGMAFYLFFWSNIQDANKMANISSSDLWSLCVCVHVCVSARKGIQFLSVTDTLGHLLFQAGQNSPSFSTETCQCPEKFLNFRQTKTVSYPKHREPLS